VEVLRTKVVLPGGGMESVVPVGGAEGPAVTVVVSIEGVVEGACVVADEEVVVTVIDVGGPRVVMGGDGVGLVEEALEEL